ncbi:ImmA/IrrE family metallo-endopeptidase [Pseudobdellovibrio sp. HCB154]|uniref:ImmA/IrrE family metallo-endopeptidase n=1 Tax=Pseudobdellovibrio sp. HCB154 TaxID=3386277 RepID=UPI0039176307
MFNSTRLVLARKRRGLSKKHLSEAIGISDRILLSYEKGDAKPSEETLKLLVKELNFPEGFFFGVDIPEVAPQSASFRALTTLPAFKRDSALAAGELATLINEWMTARFNLPQASLPDLRGHDPESAAEALRAEWGLGQGPIKNMIHLLESRGVRVFSLPSRDAEVDAFCFWRSNVPFVLLNVTKSAERSRFDAAHELAHLVLHQHGKPQGRDAELEADRFASAFLMPKASVVALGNRFITLEQMIKIKRNWNVSVAALNHRLHSTGMLSEWLYRKFCIEISERGYRKAEPNGITQEIPQIFPKIFSALKDAGINRNDLSRDLNIHTDELSSLMFGLLMTAIPGGRASGSTKTPAANLRLV